MEEREERPVGVGDDFEEGVAEERFVEGEFVEELPQRFAAAVHVPEEGGQSGLPGLVADEPLARDVVGLVVDDAAVGGRTPGHQRERRGEEVVVAPAPETVVFDAHGAQGHVGVGAVGDAYGGFEFFRFAHGVYRGFGEAPPQPAGLRAASGVGYCL